MSKETSDSSGRSSRSAGGPGRWSADLLERVGYLVTNMVVGMGLVSYQAAHATGTNITLGLTSAVVLLTGVDLLLQWKRLPHRLLTIVIYVCLIAMVVSGFFTGISVLWAVVNGVVFFSWAGMYESTRMTIEERSTA